MCLIAASILAMTKARDGPGCNHVQGLLIGIIAIYQYRWSTKVSRGKDWISPIKVFHFSALWVPGFNFFFVEICLHFCRFKEITVVPTFTYKHIFQIIPKGGLPLANQVVNPRLQPLFAPNTCVRTILTSIPKRPCLRFVDDAFYINLKGSLYNFS